MAIPSSCELVANNFIHVLSLRSLQKPIMDDENAIRGCEGERKPCDRY